jgi:hypothetical protein
VIENCVKYITNLKVVKKRWFDEMLLHWICTYWLAASSAPIIHGTLLALSPVLSYLLSFETPCYLLP